MYGDTVQINKNRNVQGSKEEKQGQTRFARDSKAVTNPIGFFSKLAQKFRKPKDSSQSFIKQPVRTDLLKQTSGTEPITVSPETLEILKLSFSQKDTNTPASALKSSKLSDLGGSLLALALGHQKKTRFAEPVVTVVGMASKDYYRYLKLESERKYWVRKKESLNSCNSVEFDGIDEKLDARCQENTCEDSIDAAIEDDTDYDDECSSSDEMFGEKPVYQTVWKRPTISSLPHQISIDSAICISDEDSFKVSEEGIKKPRLHRRPSFVSTTKLPLKSCLKPSREMIGIKVMEVEVVSQTDNSSRRFSCEILEQSKLFIESDAITIIPDSPNLPLTRAEGKQNFSRIRKLIHYKRQVFKSPVAEDQEMYKHNAVDTIVGTNEEEFDLFADISADPSNELLHHLSDTSVPQSIV
jgi:hypothetical protein